MVSLKRHRFFPLLLHVEKLHKKWVRKASKRDEKRCCCPEVLFSLFGEEIKQALQWISNHYVPGPLLSIPPRPLSSTALRTWRVHAPGNVSFVGNLTAGRYPNPLPCFSVSPLCRRLPGSQAGLHPGIPSWLPSHAAPFSFSPYNTRWPKN